MVKHFDHVTVVVEELEESIKFFELLGFVVDKSVEISGGKFAEYMNTEGIDASHVTLVLKGASPRMEIQLLHYHMPRPAADPLIKRLDKLGYNHLCLAVDDIESEVERLTQAGVKLRNEIMTFNQRKLVFFYGPGGITLELAQWLEK